MLALAWMTGYLVQERRKHAETVRVQTAVQALTAEWLRIARELHDMVAYSIGIIAIQAGMGRRVIERSCRPVCATRCGPFRHAAEGAI
ncbi:histidine kinase [Streptomyces wedmorensis]|uniref:Histidine kinase n=1 Tax=Streptomyces wedmorensis TaxID=43759 RepID=A0ABW6J3E9_STRWE